MEWALRGQLHREESQADSTMLRSRILGLSRLIDRQSFRLIAFAIRCLSPSVFSCSFQAPLYDISLSARIPQLQFFSIVESSPLSSYEAQQKNTNQEQVTRPDRHEP